MVKTKDTTFGQCDEFIDDWFDKVREWWNTLEELGEAIFYNIMSSKDEFRFKKDLLLRQRMNARIPPDIVKKQGKFQYTSGFL